MPRINWKFFFKWRLALMFSLLLGGQFPIPSTWVSADSVSSSISGDFSSPVFGSSNEFFYVINSFYETVNLNEVWVNEFQKVRTSDLQVTSSFRLGAEGTNRLVINPAGTYAFGWGVIGNTISKINLATMSATEIQVTPLEYIHEFEIDINGVYGYVSGRKYNRTVNERDIYDNSVVKINLSTGAIAGTLQGFENLRMYGIALHEAQNFGCVVDNGQGSLQGFSISPFSWSNVRGCGLVSGLNPVQIEFDSSKTFGYVSVAAEKKLLKFNLSSGEVIKAITFPSYTGIFRINPASTFAYLTDDEANPSFLYKVSLATFEIVEQIPFPTANRDIAISPNGQVGVVNTNTGLTKLNLSTSAPQSISFETPTSKLTGLRTFSLSATASSLLPISYDSTTPLVCTVSGSTVSLLDEGNCTIVASQGGSLLWDPAVSVARTFKVFLTPPSSNTGISISAGKPFSNTKDVSLEINWPEFADAVRLSNDGGFGSAVTITKRLSPTTSWVLDDSVKGVYTKVVYARFTGEGIDTTKTFFDDIILDTTAPVVSSSSASLVAGSIRVSLSASDDIAGLDKVEVRNGSQLISQEYNSNISFNGRDIGINAASALVRKFSAPKIEFRISDKAGNWSALKTLEVSGSSAPTLSSSKSVSAKSIAMFVKLKVPTSSKIRLKVASGSSKYCKVSGATVKGLKVGYCRVTVTVTPKKGRPTSKTVTLKVTK